MNILMLANRFYPYIGGVEKHTLKLSLELIKRGHKVTIITSNNNKLKEYEEYKGIKIYRLKTNNSFGSPKITRIIIFIWFIKHLKLILKADKIHCHDFSTFWNWYLPFRFILPLKDVYLTFHGWEGQVPPDPKVIKRRNISQKLTKGNISIGDYIKKWYGTNPDIVTYGGVSLPTDSRKASEERIAYVGRLEEDAGIRIYLNSLIILKNKYDFNLKTDICGNGSLYNELLKKAKKHNLNCKFHGFVNDPEKYIRDAKYVFTSGYLAILEAMAEKKLVLSVYDNELKKDYLKMIPNYQEKLVVVNSSEKLADKIFEFINNNSKYKDFINKGYNWAKSHSWSKMADNYIKLWR